jgi:hypothetical protein
LDNFIQPLRARVLVGNILFEFGLIKKEVILISKTRPDARILDGNLWIPHPQFIKACRQAAAILRKGKKQKKISLSLQQLEFQW